MMSATLSAGGVSVELPLQPLREAWQRLVERNAEAREREGYVFAPPPALRSLSCPCCDAPFHKVFTIPGGRGCVRCKAVF